MTLRDRNHILENLSMPEKISPYLHAEKRLSVHDISLFFGQLNNFSTISGVRMLHLTNTPPPPGTQRKAPKEYSVELNGA